jgi:hypothetical protein
MGTFGKRTMNTADPSPRRNAGGQARQVAPLWSDCITKADLKALEKGQIPAWATMSRMQVIGLALVAAIFVLGAVTYYGTELVRDLRYAGTYSVAYDLRASEGKCKRYMFLITDCTAKIHSAGRAQPETTAFLMFFRSGDGADLIPVRSSVDASAVSIRYAVDDVLLNRTLSLLAVTLFFSWLAWAFFDCLRNGRYKDGAAYEALQQYVGQHSTPA